MNWTIMKEDVGRSVRDYLKRKHAFSRRLLRTIKDADRCIHVNEGVQSLRYVLQEGDRINITFPPEKTAERLEANTIQLDIVYEDDVFMLVDKQASLATIPSMNHPTHTLANGLLAYYQKHGIHSTVHVVTRLDKDTSGLVLIAKNRYSHALFSRMQQAGRISRKYIAAVKGFPNPNPSFPDGQESIDAPIGRKEGSIIERAVTDAGQQALTDYNVIRVYEDAGYAFVQAVPRTGRTHQIRVHMAYIGHPVLGDDLYSHADERIKRQALHCHELTFTHPFTHEELTFQAPLPPDMKKLW